MLGCKSRSSDSAVVSMLSHLTHWIDHNVLLEIQPRFRSKQVGDVVQIDEEIFLESCQEKYYLDFASDLPHYLNDFEVKPEESAFKKDLQIFDIRFKRYKTVFSNREPVSWRVMGVKTQEDALGNICGLDYIRLYHSETDGYLCSGLKYRSKAPEVYLRSYGGDLSSNKTELSCVWQISPENTEFLCEPIKIVSNETLESENSEVDSQEIIKESRWESEPVKLQHLLSQKYLFSINFKEGSYLCLLANHTLKPQRKNFLSLKFEPVLSATTNLHDKKTYLVKSTNSKLG